MPGRPGYCGTLTDAEVEALVRDGASLAEVADRAGVSVSAASYRLHKLGLAGRRGGDRQSAGWAERRREALPAPEPRTT